MLLDLPDNEKTAQGIKRGEIVDNLVVLLKSNGETIRELYEKRQEFFNLLAQEVEKTNGDNPAYITSDTLLYLNTNLKEESERFKTALNIDNLIVQDNSVDSGEESAAARVDEL